ncbi:hypothetical protein FA13DRAFT_1812611 [Coprinellus micaceus]|uniref:DUF7918 domain-containing protein n=1 Tax=Coprinellus micaceus TaxID=71717 RepID=A0A4Y7TIM9_COPMI|nr:hypothetical protein FA13DRAFT_1812611 [Coprinellus micaceus]
MFLEVPRPELSFPIFKQILLDQSNPIGRMPSNHEIEAWIEVEGKRLEEFQVYIDVSGGEPRVVCWVPCEQGKEFSISCSLPPERVNEANHTVKVHLDGNRVGLSKNSFDKDPGETEDRVRNFTGAIVREKRIIRPFQFGTLDLTDDDSALQTSERRFGEIMLGVYSVERWAVLNEGRAKLRTVKDDYRAHERSEKGLNHCVRLGEERTLRTNQLFKAVGQKLVCTFIFNYRPMETLIAKGMAPSAEATSEPKDHAESSRNEAVLRKLKRRLEELEREEANLEDLACNIDDSLDNKEDVLKGLESPLATGEAIELAKRVKREPPHDLTHL